VIAKAASCPDDEWVVDDAPRSPARAGAMMIGKERFLHAIIGALLALLILGFFFWLGFD
jgi:hypothetical protein